MESMDFSTFCHISQYGDRGYQKLPRMIAMSRTALWAPSSVILKSGHSGLTCKKFLEYVNDRNIRIFGREEWLLDPEFRNSRPWPEAAWNEDVDGQIKEICERDRSEPFERRRVVIAPEEQSQEYVENYVATKPDEVRWWIGLLHDEKRIRTIPRGTREAAFRELHRPVEAVKRIVRDAYNHGQAISYSQADAPFLARGINPKFRNILAEAPPLVYSGTNIPPVTRYYAKTPAIRRKYVDLKLSDIAEQMMMVLGAFDKHARNRLQADSLDRFIGGEGRENLMQWISKIYGLTRRSDARKVDGLVLDELVSDLSCGKFSNVWEEFRSHLDETLCLIGGAGTALIGIATAPVVAGIGVATSTYPIVKGIGRQAGFVPGTFSGPKWPFLYAYDRNPNRRYWTQLQDFTNQLQSDAYSDPADIP
ncbi:MAG TPA: hypothetical protein VIT43_03530 [Candidatus Dormibacteraeota bacterium]